MKPNGIVGDSPDIPTVWVIVNYDDHDQPVYGVYASHETAANDYRENFPKADFPNLRMEEWAIL